jgi:hypothetical protein
LSQIVMARALQQTNPHVSIKQNARGEEMIMKKTSLIAVVLTTIVAVGPITLAVAQATPPATQPTYSSAYKSLRLTRDASGVLLVELNTSGGPLTFSAHDHTDFVDAFYRIAQDRDNKIVILTGAGGEFITGVDFQSFGNVADPDVWSQVHDEGVQIL